MSVRPCGWDEYAKLASGGCAQVREDPANSLFAIYAFADLAIACDLHDCPMVGERSLYLAFINDQALSCDVACCVSSADPAILTLKDLNGSEFPNCTIRLPERTKSPKLRVLTGADGRRQTSIMRKRIADLEWRGSSGESVCIEVFIYRSNLLQNGGVMGEYDWRDVIDTRPQGFSTFVFPVSGVFFK